MLITVFILGFTALTAQSAFLREILAVFRGGELIFGAALFFWLLWTTAGSAVFGKTVRFVKNPEELFYSLLPWYGISGFIGIVFIKNIHFIAGLIQGEHVSYGIQILAVSVAMMPFNFIGGYLFVLASKSIRHDSSPSPSRAYTSESLGSALAGLIFSFFLIYFLSNYLIAILCPALTLLTCLFRKIRKKNYRGILLLIVPLSFVVIINHINEKVIDYYYKGQTLIEEKDTKYSRLRVTQRGEQINFYSGASVLFSYPDAETIEYNIHIPMLVSEYPENVLILGGSFKEILREIAKYKSVKSVTFVEIDPSLFKLTEKIFKEKSNYNFKIETVFSDSRVFLENTDKKFDTIIADMPAPLSGLTNRYYTSEYFRLLSGRLSNEGVFSFALPGAENYISDEQAAFLSSIRATLSTAFPSVAALPGIQCRFLAGNSPHKFDSLDWEFLEMKRTELGIETLYLRDYYLKYTMSENRVDYIKKVLDSIKKPEINLDTRPVGYISNIIIQGNIESSKFIKIFEFFTQEKILLPIMLLIITAIAFLTFFRGAGNIKYTVVSSVVSTGLTGISIEILAIMAFQSVLGYLYGRIALLIGFYMAGLATGGYFGIKIIEKNLYPVKQLFSLQTAMILIPMAWMVLIFQQHHIADKTLTEIIFYLMIAFSGIFGGIQYPIADFLFRKSFEKNENSLGTIYGIDLAGSSLGALVTASLFIPAAGMFQTLIFLSVLNVPALIGLYVMKNRT